MQDLIEKEGKCCTCLVKILLKYIVYAEHIRYISTLHVLFQVKLVWYYNNALGRPNKKKFIARAKSYS